MNNAVYGKTMENIENHVDIRLVSDKVLATKLASQPNFEKTTIFDENLVAIHMKRTELLYNKPIYIGMCILDWSKILMYEFHYDYIKNKYGDNAELLQTDTDSLMYKIETEDFFEDIKNDLDRFDTSTYPEKHICYNENNKMVIGKFKDEAAGKHIEEYVGLRSKLYSYIINGEANKKCKGISMSAIKNNITFEDYLDCYNNGNEHLKQMNVIRSHSHELFTEEINKVALNRNDDKRIILKDKKSTLAYGHYNENNIERLKIEK